SWGSVRLGRARHSRWSGSLDSHRRKPDRRPTPQEILPTLRGDVILTTAVEEIQLSVRNRFADSIPGRSLSAATCSRTALTGKIAPLNKPLANNARDYFNPKMVTGSVP